MYEYAIWVDLAPGAKDAEFVDAMSAFLGHHKSAGTIDGWTLQRRTFGFGPDGLGEFSIRIRTHSLAQLESALLLVTPRDGELEQLHVEVFRRVTNFRAALYRDFPDANRA